MRILLDECTPSIVKKSLPHRQIETVQELGWSGIKNGDLLRSASGVFDVLITTDKNLQYQQNLKAYELGIVVLPTNQVPIVEMLLPTLDTVLDEIGIGDYIELNLPSS